MRTVAYVRYSSERQRADSAADQVALLTRLAVDRGWPAPTVYADPAISGTHTDRPELQRLLHDATARRIDVLLIEDLSRLSRDLGEGDRLVKTLRHHGVRIVSANGFDSDTEWSRLQVGLEGLMNEAYIRDLAARTHRGQQGAIDRGHSAGGRAYGYRSEPVTDAIGSIVGYRRIIDQSQAPVVRHIFERFACGATAYQIVRELNATRIPGPRGGTWARSAIYPDKRLGVGILGNPLYIGQLIWNRTRWERIPGTKRRKRIERPPQEWQRADAPDLRIIDQDLWDRVQARVTRSAHKPGRRGTGLLTGILKCATCGANYVAINTARLGCAAHKERGPEVCQQSITLERERTEQRILDYVRRDLYRPEAVEYFISELLRQQAAHQPDLSHIKRRIRDAEQRASNILRAIEAGIFTDSTAAALRSAESERDAARADLAAAQTPITGHIDPRIIHRRMLARLGQTADRTALRAALADILGAVEISGTTNGPVAKIEQGRAMAALVDNSGSGGALRLISTDQVVWIAV